MRQLIEIKDLYKIYKSGDIHETIETVALKGVSLDINSDDFIAVMGASGSGKTTLLSILGGLERASAGSIIYHLDRQVNLANMNEAQLDNFRHDKIGVIFQVDNLIYHLTALENVELPLKFLGRANVTQKAKELLDKLGLHERYHHTPAMLSAGERQRVALATALAFKPMIIFADEPTGELDSENLQQVMELFQTIHKEEHVTFFIVTHNPNVAKYANRYFSLNDGKLLEQSSISSFEMVHSATGSYIITVDKLKRLSLPHQLLAEIQINDGAISYTYTDNELRISTYRENAVNTTIIDQNNRVLLSNEVNAMLNRPNYLGIYDPTTEEIVITLEEVQK